MSSSVPIRVLSTGQSAYCACLLQNELGTDRFTVTHITSRSSLHRALEEGAADVVLTDVDALGFSRMGVLDIVKAARPAMPVVFFSAIDSVPVAVAAMKRGAADYIVNPHYRGLLGPALIEAVTQCRT
jgi:DNA-binding NtrC family response regulator